VLDNNGYIVVSESPKDTGKFFGEVQGSIMEIMVQEELYKRIHMLDYQAVCFREDALKNKAPFLVTVSCKICMSWGVCFDKIDFIIVIRVLN
jgi:voltage-dependent calcium channel alpha-2/delta-3